MSLAILKNILDSQVLQFFMQFNYLCFKVCYIDIVYIIIIICNSCNNKVSLKSLNSGVHNEKGRTWTLPFEESI